MESSRKISVGLLLFCIFFFPSFSRGAASPESTKLNVRQSFQEKLRVKRQECQDGTYENEGINCCKCAAGQRVEKQCTKTATDGKCEPCEKGTYNSEPNNKDSCEICTSCGPESANLEVEESCTPARDTKCKCKKGYYCPKGDATCKACHLCTTCKSIKEECTAISDAVCNEGLSGGAIAGIVIVLVVAALVLVAVVFRKAIVGRFKQDISSSPGPVDDPLLPVEMEPHIVEVAEIIGWKDMNQIALSCRMANSIENVKLSHPSDSEMWTLELLRIWVEQKGMGASVELITTLRKLKKNNKADKIKDMLYPTDSPTKCSSA